MNPPPNQIWECRACGLVAEWHPAAEGGYYAHCGHRDGLVFVMYTDRCNTCNGTGRVRNRFDNAERACPQCTGAATHE